jgi:hypothetical protein
MAPASKKPARGVQPATNATAPYAVEEPANLRTPTWRQWVAVALYVYFIPFFFVANLLMLTNIFTFVPWLL